MVAIPVAYLKQRLSSGAVLLYLAVAGGILVATGDVALVVGLSAAFLLLEVRELLRTVPGIGKRQIESGFAVVLVGASIVWLGLTLRQSPDARMLWLPTFGVLGALWMLLDARVGPDRAQDSTGSDIVDDLDNSELLVRGLHAHLVADSLEDGPKTVPELAADCDLSESRVRDALDVAVESAVITRKDETETPRYELDESRLGISGLGRQASDWGLWVARRLTRPFRRVR